MAEEEAEVKTTPGVGVLGWLGFVIVNVAIWGIIGVSTALAWYVGFGVTFIYTAALIAMAGCIRRVGATRFASFENLLWVLSCWFVFVLGMHLSLNVVPAGDNKGTAEDVVAHPDEEFMREPFRHTTPKAGDLVGLLPAASSAAVRSWAANVNEYTVAPDHAEYGGRFFFRGILDDGRDMNELLCKNGSDIVNVTPPVVNPQNFAPLASKLYLLANGDMGEKSLWAIDAAGATATLVDSFEGVDTVWHLKAIDGSLYVKAGKVCNREFLRTILVSNVTVGGFTDLRGPGCPASPTEPGGGGVTPDDWADNKPVNQLWGVVFLACVPMLVMAAILLWKFQMPGLFSNLYYGFSILVTTLFVIGATDYTAFEAFLKWFLTLQAVLCLGAFTLVCLLRDPLPKLLGEMSDWIVVISSITFFVMIHISLQIPFAGEAWGWVIYALLIPVMMLVSISVVRTLPFVLAALQMFIVAWKISYEIVRAAFGGSSLDAESTLVLLAILAFQGVAIIAGSIVYAMNRGRIDEAVRGVLLRCLGRRRLLTPEGN